MVSIQDLKQHTEAFFQKHWDKSADKPFPNWSDKWSFLGPVPHNEMAGCYAWLKNEEVVYIGVALNKGLRGYEGHSLGTRISKYWNLVKNKRDEKGDQFYQPAENIRKHEIDGIITLPFEDQKYLALALECYLIQQLSPPINLIYRS